LRLARGEAPFEVGQCVELLLQLLGALLVRLGELALLAQLAGRGGGALPQPPAVEERRDRGDQP
jgi:hypothetical protein